MARAALGVLLLATLSALAQPPGSSELQVRLKTDVSTEKAKAGDPVEAVVLSGPFMRSAVRGSVVSSATSSNADQRATLVLKFTELDAPAGTLAIDACVAAIDNAREHVDDKGQILGILASETMTGKLDEGLERLGGKYSGLADVLSAVKKVVLKPATTEIAYSTGAEMTLRLAAPLASPGEPLQLPKPVAGRDLDALIADEPFQTIAQRPPKPSDITNLLLVGSEEEVRRAFADAGWAVAASLTPQAKFETLRALAEDRGYNEAPVSVLMLDGKTPDIVFEKTTNTFARRHHLRVWLRPVRFRGSPVWAVAATHDVGINFSDADRTFIHRIDSNIDRERDKVVDDLVFTGRVQGLSLLQRPQVPQHGRNATGDSVETDARIAVVLLN
jgi:hypothetical protein